MKETRSSLSAHEAQFLTYVSEHPDTSFSELVNSQQSSVGIQDGFNLVQNLLHRGLLDTNAPAMDFYFASRIDITPAGTAALWAYREAHSSSLCETVLKIVTLVASASPVIVSLASAAHRFFL